MSELSISNVIAAFSEQQAEALTRLSKTRLRYWDKTEFFSPSYVADGRGPSTRFYSFRDIVALRTLEVLRVQNKVPLQHLREVANRLSHLKDSLWTKTTLFVLNRKVLFENPETGKPEEVVSGQYVLDSVPLLKIIGDTTADVNRMKSRARADIGMIQRDRGICNNAWRIAGTRIPIVSIQRLYEDGYSIKAIIGEYPDLKEKDVRAALAHNVSKAA